MYGDGQQTRDFTHVANAVSGSLLPAAQGKPGSVYNIASDHPTTINQCIQLIERLLARKARVVCEAHQAGEPRHLGADISLAQEDLGFEAQVSLEEGLSAQVAHLRGGFNDQDS